MDKAKLIWIVEEIFKYNIGFTLQQTGYTPLMFATRGGHIQIVQRLVSHSVNLDITDKVGTLEVRTSISVKYNSKAIATITLN